MAYNRNGNNNAGQQNNQPPQFAEGAFDFQREDGTCVGVQFRVYPVKANSNTLALCSISVAGLIAVETIRIVVNREGNWFLAFPQVKKTNGEYRDIAFPIAKGFRQALEDNLCQAYDEFINGKR